MIFIYWAIHVLQKKKQIEIIMKIKINQKKFF